MPGLLSADGEVVQAGEGPRAASLSHGSPDIGVTSFFVGGCPVHHRTCNSFPGLLPLNTSSTPLLPHTYMPTPNTLVVTPKNVSRHCQVAEGGGKIGRPYPITSTPHPGLRGTALDQGW